MVEQNFHHVKVAIRGCLVDGPPLRVVGRHLLGALLQNSAANDGVALLGRDPQGCCTVLFLDIHCRALLT